MTATFTTSGWAWNWNRVAINSKLTCGDLFLDGRGVCNIFSFFWSEEILQEITHDLWGGIVRKLCKGAACKNDESISQG